MAQPGGKRRPALGEHEHHRGKKRTDSPGMRGHDPQTQPAAEQRPTLAGSGKVARGLSEAPETRVATTGNSKKEKTTKYTQMGQSPKRIEVSEIEAEEVETLRACQIQAGQRGGAAPTEISERKGSQRDRAGEHGPLFATAEGSIARLDREEVVARSKPPRFLSLRRRFRLRPCPQKPKYAATDPKGLAASGRICFVPV